MSRGGGEGDGSSTRISSCDSSTFFTNGAPRKKADHPSSFESDMRRDEGPAGGGPLFIPTIPEFTGHTGESGLGTRGRGVGALRRSKSRSVGAAGQPK